MKMKTDEPMILDDVRLIVPTSGKPQQKKNSKNKNQTNDQTQFTDF